MRAAGGIGIDSIQIYSVEEVEEIDAQIELDPLGNAGDFFKSGVDLSESGIAELIDLFVPFLPELREGEQTAAIQVGSGAALEYAVNVALPVLRDVVGGNIREISVIAVCIEVSGIRLIDDVAARILSHVQSAAGIDGERQS